MADIGADVVKIGMLGDAATIACVADVLAERAPGVPVVLDPVMVAKGGQVLMAPEALSILKERLIPLASLLTPNLPEAAMLAGRPIPDLPTMRQAAEMLRTLGVPAVLLKGGHLPGGSVTDLLADDDGIETFAAPRIVSRNTHGTGCTLASAIAAGLAQGMALRDAVVRARAYVRAAIETAPALGAGHGPLNHAVTCNARPLRPSGSRR